MPHRGERLDERRLLERKARGQRMQVARGQGYVLAERAFDLAPEEPSVAAAVLGAAPALVAVPAGDDRIDDYMLAALQIAHAVAEGFDHACGLVPQHHRIAHA